MVIIKCNTYYWPIVYNWLIPFSFRLSNLVMLCVSGGHLDSSLGVEGISSGGGSVLTVVMLTSSGKVCNKTVFFQLHCSDSWLPRCLPEVAKIQQKQLHQVHISSEFKLLQIYFSLKGNWLWNLTYSSYILRYWNIACVQYLKWILNRNW